MRPLSLTVEGFTCFKEKQGPIDFEKLQLFVISGPTGSGKSSLLDAMVFALYGSVPRIGKHGLSELVSLGRDRMSVTFDFAAGGQRYRVYRQVRRKGAGTARLEQLDAQGARPLADKVRDVDDRVQQILGLRYDAFVQSVVLPQGAFDRFLRSDPGKRREILRDLLRLHVYERMRKKASDTHASLAVQVQSLEERLTKDYAGVTAEAVAATTERLKQLRAASSAAENELTRIEAELAMLRGRFEKTAELKAKREQAEKLALRDGEIQDKKGRLDRAAKAATVVPLIEAAVSHESAAAEDAKRVETAATHLRQGEEARRNAEAKRAEAEQAAADIPRLRERIARLDALTGIIEARQRAARRRSECEKKKTDLEKKIAVGEEVLARAASKQRAAKERLTQAAAKLESSGYNQELDARIEAVRDDATKLAELRRRLETARLDSTRETQEAAKAREVATATADTLRRRKAEFEHAERSCRGAEEALRVVEKRHAAAGLREGLVAGDVCPVCEQTAANPPPKYSPPDLEEARKQRDATHVAQQKARAKVEAATHEFARFDTEARQRESRAATLASRVDQLATELETTEARLLAGVGADLQDETHEPLEVRIQRRAHTLGVQRKAYQEATSERQEAELAAQRAAHEVEQKTSELKSSQQMLGDLQVEIDSAAKEIESLADQIETVTTAADPAAERNELAAHVERLETEHMARVKAAHDAATAYVAAETKLEEARRSAAHTSKEAEAARKRAREAALEAGFVDEDVARESALTAEVCTELLREVEHHARETHALRERIQELETELAEAGEVTEEEVRAAEANRDRKRQAREELIAEAASLKEKLATLKRRLRDAQKLEKELFKTQGRYGIFKRLADDLRGERFQAYLLEESFRELLEGASQRLIELSGRYTFVLEQNEFHVLDHDNAQERRRADTLSGGETFLASLALALELSQQVQRAAGAVQLDSLFIDEGFGTLDAETLDVVTQAIQSLNVGGRVVGIITHIPELTDQLPERILVEKRQEGSRISVEEE